MDSTITLMGSIVIGALFMLSVMTFYDDVIEHQNVRMQEMWTQESMASVAEIIDYDFRKIGSGVANASQAIVSISDSTDITFLADIDNDAVAETVRYYLSDADQAPNTENPNDKILYRIVNGTTTINTSAGVTQFSVKLYDWTGSATTELNDVAIIDIFLEVQSEFQYGDVGYPVARWQKRVTPVNIIRITNQNL